MSSHEVRAECKALNGSHIIGLILDGVEIWKPISGYSDHEVSSFGRVRSSTWGNKIKVEPYFKKPYVCGHIKQGKDYFAIKIMRGGKSKRFRLHNLVAEAFLGPRPEGYHVAHLDGDRFHDKLVNLAWVTPKENEKHKSIHGRTIKGEMHVLSKLKKEDVVLILASKESSNRIAQKYGVSGRLIRKIRAGQNWMHIERTAA